MPLVGDPRSWDTGTRQGTIWAAMADVPSHGHFPGRGKCSVCETTYARLLPTLGEEPLTFKSGGEYLPRGAQRARRLRNLIAEIHAYGHDFRPDAPIVAPAPIAAPKPKAPKATHDDVERFVREVERLRVECDRRGHDTLNSMRVTQDGIDAIFHGASIDGLLASIGATWQDDTKTQTRIPTFDPMTFGERPHPFAHGSAAYVTALVKAGIPVWMHGPAGTGKSSAAKAAAKAAGLDYYEVNLAGAMASAIKGKDRLKSFVETAFIKAYRDGGLICLEEFDAAHPTVAVAINNAIAGDQYHNDADDAVYDRHPDFRVVATANTLGTGGTKEFNGRNKLDGATLDRFRLGRVYVGLDRQLERAIIDAKVAKHLAAA